MEQDTATLYQVSYLVLTAELLVHFHISLIISCYYSEFRCLYAVSARLTGCYVGTHILFHLRWQSLSLHMFHPVQPLC